MNLLDKVFLTKSKEEKKFPEETPKKPIGQAIIIEDTPIEEYFPNEEEHENNPS